jgi:flavin-dependent dehydrogenase
MKPHDQGVSVATERTCDVLVVGGGPAGATTATALAERGYRVTVIEKDRHPRFHIGESLLPLNLPLLDQLGVRGAIEHGAIRKYGVQFVSPYHGKSITYDFSRAFDKRFPYAFQVRRSVFDHILLQNAKAKGAEVIEGMRVTAIDLSNDREVRVTARDENDTEDHWRARFVVDASGRDTFLAGHLSLKQRNPKNNTAAVFGHFTGARRLPGKAEGNITIVWFDHGWFWFIPLIDGTTSIGAVCPAQVFKTRNTTDLSAFLMSLIAEAPEIADRLKDAQLVSPAIATGNYSYASTTLTGPNHLLVGDACAFIDPVFSAGVYLAMSTAFFGADAIDTCLRQPARAERALRSYDRRTRQALGAFTWFIYRIREPAMRNLFMSPRNFLHIEETVLSLLAGDIFSTQSLRRTRLMLFRLIYYVTKFSHLRHRLRRWRRETSVPLDAAV